MNTNQYPDLRLFDAVQIVRFDGPEQSKEPYYSQISASRIELGDIGSIIGDWTSTHGTYRVEAVNANGNIVWQDHFRREQLAIVDVTKATFNRPRINQAWADWLRSNHQVMSSQQKSEAMEFARKVMAHAKLNVDMLVTKLENSGYIFAYPESSLVEPEDGIAEAFQLWSDRGVHVPIALQAWFEVVGSVNLCGTHPSWNKSGFGGLEPDSNKQVWYTDPLVLETSIDWMESMFRAWDKLSEPADRERDLFMSLAPDDVHKANNSGGAPVGVSTTIASFDTLLWGQSGGHSLLSYLRHAFNWAGFPGFQYYPDAPTAWLQELSAGLIKF